MPGFGFRVEGVGRLLVARAGERLLRIGHHLLVKSLGVRVWGVEFGVWDLGFEVCGSGCRVQDLGFGVQGLGSRV